MPSSGAACAALAATSAMTTAASSVLRMPCGCPDQRRRNALAHLLEVLRVDLALLAAVAALRQRGLLLAALERVQVVHVLVEDAQRDIAGVGRAVARHDRLGRLHERAQPGEGGA